jgi:hypothetical protein
MLVILFFGFGQDVQLSQQADVGGGSVTNDTPNALARIPLRWMVCASSSRNSTYSQSRKIRETFRCHTGILWDIDGLKSIGLEPDLLYPKVIVPSIEQSTSGSVPRTSKSLEDSASVQIQEDPELLDALSPIYDQLSIAPGWWVLEIFPTKGRKQLPPPKDFDTWKSYFLYVLISSSKTQTKRVL